MSNIDRDPMLRPGLDGKPMWEEIRPGVYGSPEQYSQPIPEYTEEFKNFAQRVKDESTLVGLLRSIVSDLGLIRLKNGGDKK